MNNSNHHIAFEKTKGLYLVLLLLVTMSFVACETDDIIPVGQKKSIDSPTNPYQGKKISIISHSMWLSLNAIIIIHE